MNPSCSRPRPVRPVLPIGLLLACALAAALPAQAQTEVCIESSAALVQAFNDIDGSQPGAITFKLRSGTFTLGSNLDLDYRAEGDPQGNFGRLTLRGGYSAGCTTRTNALGATTLVGSGGQRIIDIELINNDLLIERITSSNIDWFIDNWVDYADTGHQITLSSVQFLNTSLGLGSTRSYDFLIGNSLLSARSGTLNDMVVRFRAHFRPDQHMPVFAIANSTVRGGGVRLDFLPWDDDSDPPGPATVKLSSSVLENDGLELAIAGGDLYSSHNRYDSLSIIRGQVRTNLGNIASPALLQSNGVPQNNSPVVNNGTRFVPGGLPASDLAGNPRHVGVDPDMGAFETAVDNSLYLDVTNTAASGGGSLAQAVASANSVDGRQVIRFNIAGGCPRTITLNQALVLTDDTDILGETQPGTVANSLATGHNGQPCIILRAGTGVGSAFIFDSAQPGDNLKLSQLAFSGFTADAVSLRSGGGHLITGNRFGGSVGGVALLDVGTAIRAWVSAHDVQIGGTEPQQSNLIGNANFGIVLDGPGGNSVLNNAFGDAGFQQLPNAIGLLVYSPGNLVDDNLIAHSTGFNVLISGASVRDNVVRDNAIIGADIHGLNIAGGAHRNRIGPNNHFTGNGADGIYIASGAFNDLSRNRFSGNGGLAIDLAPDGVTPNDPDPLVVSNNSPNRNQNFPVITRARPMRLLQFNYVGLDGSLSSTEGTYRIDVYRNTSCDPSGHGEGTTLLGASTVELACTIFGPGMQCSRPFDLLIPGEVQPGQYISATVTSPGGNTSEFSACREVTSSDVIFADDFD